MIDFIPGKTWIPTSGYIVGDLEANNLQPIVDNIRKGILPKYELCAKFEKRFAKVAGQTYCHMVNSGSSANELAVQVLMAEELGTLRLKPGDEIITTALTFPTSLAPIIRAGLIPVFVDVDLPYYVPVRRTDYDTAVFAVHLFGNTSSQIFRGTHWIIGDCCDALGTENFDNSLASFSNISTFSFYPAHHITTLEGGAVCTSDPKFSKLIKSFRDWGRDCWCEPGQNNACGHRFDGEYDHKYIYSHIGYNFKATDFQAALGLAQLDRLEGFIEKRKHNFERLSEGLKDCDWLILPKPTPFSDVSWFGFPLTIREDVEMNARDMQIKLAEYKIDSRRIFAGNILKQPAYKNIKHRTKGELPNTNLIHEKGFWIGLYPGITDEMIDYMIEVICILKT